MYSTSGTLIMPLQLLAVIYLSDQHGVSAAGPGGALMRTSQGYGSEFGLQNSTYYARLSALRELLYSAASNDGGDGDKKEIWINYDEPRGGRVCYRARPSDKLKFYWDEYHNLKELKDANAYNSCDFSGATNHQGKGEPNSGKFIDL